MASQELRSISEVERDTGLPRATIRIWERRYGFPAPQRDERGERSYPHDQVQRLRLMRELVERGHRPGRLLAADEDELRALHGSARDEEASHAAPPLRATAELLRLLRRHDAAGLRRHLATRLERYGLEEFAAVDVPAMNRLVGDGWTSGELQIHEEHLYSDCVAEVLRAGIARRQDDTRPEAPVVLLTTLPQEPHALGLLIAQAVFAAQGCPTRALGVRLPVEQIVAAAQAHGAHLVGLSCTGAINPTHLLRGLEELRGMLPPEVRIWAGGTAAVLRRRSVAGVRPVPDARAIPALLAEDFALPPLAAA